MTVKEYEDFIFQAYELLTAEPLYFVPTEDINSLELAHLIPQLPESIITTYLAINDAVCNKGLVNPFLVRHGYNNVFVFDSQVYAGGNDVPSGTIDAKRILQGFKTPNST